MIFLQSFDILIVLLNKRKGTERNFSLHNNVRTFFWSSIYFRKGFVMYLMYVYYQNHIMCNKRNVFLHRVSNPHPITYVATIHSWKTFFQWANWYIGMQKVASMQKNVSLHKKSFFLSLTSTKLIFDKENIIGLIPQE